MEIHPNGKERPGRGHHLKQAPLNREKARRIDTGA
jgi:hypothetical protein